MEGRHFNPHTPCGVRPCRLPVDRTRVQQFQSTHPLRGATAQAHIFQRLSQISIHAPLAGCDLLILQIHLPGGHFNPRPPCGVRPRRPEPAVTRRQISIHAPLAGCDQTAKPDDLGAGHFNPRPPCGVRHAAEAAYGLTDDISIHAPLAGCDVIKHIQRESQRRISIHAPLAGCDSKNIQRKLRIFELADKLSARIVAKKPFARVDCCA